MSYQAYNGGQNISPSLATVWHDSSCLELLYPALPTFSSAYWSTMPLQNTESLAVLQVCTDQFWNDRKVS